MSIGYLWRMLSTCRLQAGINLIFGMSSSTANITILTPVSTNCTGMHGCPRKNMDPNVLHEVFRANRQIPKTVLANVLGIDQNTLNTWLKELNIDSGFSDISDPELDAHVQEYLQENPARGHAYVIGRLQAASLHIQCEHVVDAMNCVDRLGQGLRKQEETQALSCSTSKFLVAYWWSPQAYCMGHCHSWDCQWILLQG